MSGTMDSFLQVMDELLGEEGCPWDRAQTMESLKPCMIDEFVEALAGIRICQETGNGDNLCEELGDVLMHIVMLANIARAQGLFTMEDVIRGIEQKMLRRHPHVFGEDALLGWSESQLEQGKEMPSSWDEIKKLEKKEINQNMKELQKRANDEAVLEVVNYLDKTDITVYK